MPTVNSFTNDFLVDPNEAKEVLRRLLEGESGSVIEIIDTGAAEVSFNPLFNDRTYIIEDLNGMLNAELPEGYTTFVNGMFTSREFGIRLFDVDVVKNSDL